MATLLADRTHDQRQGQRPAHRRVVEDEREAPPSLLSLQRLAGNAAVARLVSGVVQRSGCGGSCGCGGTCGERDEAPVVQRSCAGGEWKYDYDGCSVPAAAVAAGRGQHGSFDKDNPAGGSDTQFAFGKPTTRGGVACDRHDECYQSCSTDRLDCDERMYHDMKAICAASGENRIVRARCWQFATIYYKALRVGAQGAFDSRKKAVCGCDASLVPPAMRYPPRHLLERHRKPISWLTYKIMSDTAPLSAYKPFADQEEYERYLASSGGFEALESIWKAIRHL
jgi:hypothetical protein